MVTTGGDVSAGQLWVPGPMAGLELGCPILGGQRESCS